MLLNTTKCIMITIYICIYIIMCIITFIRFVVLPEVDTVAPHMSHIPGLSPFLSKCVQIRLLFLLVEVGMGEALVLKVLVGIKAVVLVLKVLVRIRAVVLLLKVLVESGAIDRDEVGGRRTDIEVVLVGVVDTNLDVEAISTTNIFKQTLHLCCGYLIMQL